ncbi:2',3'-cyclic-nucleotide 2'-phosphodiesterase/5'-or 3'-nucleotidase, 5'-nucleotidase family [Ruminococcaceae bacterium FB2012]|nr:2',3'-cyclic-nucleotide 2'-phosphodiesterase/5'-or 3'-nucleotidase, 5'-nucleotidase family [Ruminococcaceae bacterium FB2012]
MKKLLAFLTAVTVAAGGLCLPAAAETADDETVILFTNDVHCGVDDVIGYDGLALYKREMQAKHKNVLLVDAGDFIQGANLGSLSKGEYITELMNEVGYDAVALGNHEFDYGIPTLSERTSELDCGVICCNLTNTETGEKLCEPYKIFDLGDEQIAFVGVTTPDTFGQTTPAFFQNDEGEYIYDFGQKDTQLYDIVQENVDKARAEGADRVILLAHLGENNVVEKWSSEAVAANTVGVDAVISGHSHEVTLGLTVNNKEGKPVQIAQTGTKLNNIGKMTLSGDSIDIEMVDTVPEPSEDMGLDNESWKKTEDRGGRYIDTAVSGKIAELKGKLEELIGQKIGHSNFKLWDSDPETGERRVRNGETNLGNFAADIFRAVYGTDIAFLNGGGLRASIEAGDISFGDVYNVMPFGNNTCSAKITGRQLLDYLEYSVKSYPEEEGCFSSVSGIEFSIDPTVKSSVITDEYGDFKGVDGEYRVKEVFVNGEPLDLEKTYTAASISYLLQGGGDAHILSGHCEILEERPGTDAELVAEYIKKLENGEIPEKYRDPYGEGRIKLYEEKSGEDGSSSDEDSSVPDSSSESETSGEDSSGQAKNDDTNPATGHAAAAGITVLLLLTGAAAAGRRRQ